MQGQQAGNRKWKHHPRVLLKPQALREASGPLWLHVNWRTVKEACGSFGRGNQDKKVKHSKSHKEERGGEVGAIPQKPQPKFAKRVIGQPQGSETAEKEKK